MITRRSHRMKWVALLAAPAMLLVGCAGDSGEGDVANGGTIELTLAHSYNPDQPQDRCGAQVIADDVNSADVGLKIELFGSSQLGGDADRVASVASGDIDIDIQGASALGAVYEPISVLDAAYAFDDADHLAAFMASDASKTLTDAFAEETGIHALGVWSAGARHFTANTPIRTPDDLDGLRIRFPGSPQFLMNAKALGAQATEVAYEELYLALQQGTVEGQENPITNIKSQNLSEVQDYLSLSAHQLNTNVVIMSSKWDELNDEQQTVLQDAVEHAVTEVTTCVADDEETTLEEWRTAGDWEIVDDVDVDAFQKKAVAYLSDTFTGDSLEVFEAIRSTSSK
ncbi:tripartite ATP-independent transporter DctP family solute receptor [Homoserinimonas aerilata]|uniref:Tripartite ATP-independent transporter DctP family solute receptor n=1 Tax=Homoserinimonas aerilata TaxID=1162970 RepID=A0A542XX83_9MICO|nr:DctP family TRAP transporter solute-binding subunit [Homoserinimonas aerilata]TQL40438.1 tripartite ATP-independent transporter DctP family solute receptor [Homoserinimonas aerilata]